MVRKANILSHPGLINCELAVEKQDSAIYRVQTANIIQWAHKVYTYNCHWDRGHLLTGCVKNLSDHLKINSINPGLKNI